MPRIFRHQFFLDSLKQAELSLYHKYTCTHSRWAKKVALNLFNQVLTAVVRLQDLKETTERLQYNETPSATKHIQRLHNLLVLASPEPLSDLWH